MLAAPLLQWTHMGTQLSKQRRTFDALAVRRYNNDYNLTRHGRTTTPQ
jgi:hypothetical protein